MNDIIIIFFIVQQVLFCLLLNFSAVTPYSLEDFQASPGKEIQESGQLI